MECFAGSNSDTAAEDLVGTWRLLSVSAWRDGKLVEPHPYGRGPSGFIHYLAGGRMSVIISYGQRSPLSGDRLNAPLGERAEAYSTLIAYAGTYKILDDTIVHRIEVSAFPNEIATEQVRHFRLDGNVVHLTTVPLSRGGIPTTYRLAWERMGQRTPS